jgi:oligosaccharide repeat unit polymerase
MQVAVGLVALCVATASAYLGRRDLTRPGVVFGIVWFGFVALAQLQLTSAESTWSASFAAVVIGGGLAFMAATLAAAGTRPARGTLRVDRGAYKTNRLLAAAVLLICGAVAGWVYKSHVLGGIPLLSDSIDVVRSRSYSAQGSVTVPAWASALTGGFYLAFWSLLAVAWLDWPTTSWRRRGLVLALAAGCLFGVALDGSRNLVLEAIAIPIAATYLMATPAARRGTTVLKVGLAVALVAVVVGGAFLVRLGQTSASSGGNGFVSTELRRTTPVLRPLLPVYINGVLPLDGLQSLRDAIPTHAPWGRGAYSLLSLPDKAFPRGKPEFGSIVANQLAERGVGFWTVSSYQGRAFGDFGETGVIAVSLLLGLLFGGAYRFARQRSGIFALVLISYVAYYTAFLIYDNLLSFTLIGFYDLAVVFAVERFASGELGWRGRPSMARTG